LIKKAGYANHAVDYSVLAHVLRGDILESVHLGAAAEVDSTNKVLSSLGDPQIVTTLRSSAKPLQAIPLVTTPGVETLNLSDEELAICCASHSGEPRHSALAASVLALSGFPPDNLVCGPAGRHGSPLDHGCSGNHAAILLTAKLNSFPLEGYYLPDHQVQTLIAAIIEELSGTKNLAIAQDGCGIPTYGMKLQDMARAFAALVCPGAPWSRIPDVMARQYDLIGSPDWIDVRLMQVTSGRIIAKTGAEGLLCLGCRHTGRGMAVKIADGSTRALGAVTISYLLFAGWISEDEAQNPLLLDLRHPILRSSTGDNAADIRTVEIHFKKG
jgi:L-asparaginase II